jgi:hypothetical protein
MRVALMILALLSSGAAHAEKMRVNHLRSADGIEVVVNYGFDPVCQPFTENGKEVNHKVRFAKPVQFSIKNLAEGVNVEIQVEFWGQYRGHDGGENPIMRLWQFPDLSINLTQVGKTWIGKTESLAVRDELVDSHDSWQIFQTLRIVIGDRPLIDPVSNTDWFRISLDDNRSCVPK